MKTRHAEQIRYGILLARAGWKSTTLTAHQWEMLNTHFSSGGYGLIDTRLEQRAYDHEIWRLKETR